MPSINSTATTGKVACWKSVRIDLPVHPVAVIRVVADLEGPQDVEDFEAALGVLEVVLEDTADAAATEVAMVVHPLEVSTTLLLQALPLRHRTPLPTTLHLEENQVS